RMLNSSEASTVAWWSTRAPPVVRETIQRMALQQNGKVERRDCPVFVVGCHRSGTNLVYDTLLSAGGFAIHRGYLPIYKMLIPRFGRIDKLENRRRIVETWLLSKGFRRSGLDAEAITAELMAGCRTGGDFIRIVMDNVAREQKAPRWVLYDPDNALRLPLVKKDFPAALIIHMVRDGRDIALSLKKMAGFRPLPWDRKSRGLEATALFWEWMVRKGRSGGRRFPEDYIEIHYEDLVSNPREILARLGQFLDHDLDFDRIQRTALGRLTVSNSSFRDEEGKDKINPVNRWKERLSPAQTASLEALVGRCLAEMGYSLSVPESERRPGLREAWMRTVYLNYLDAKFWAKMNTPLGRLANLSAMELSDAPPQPTAAPPR
ncbi:MAG: sulfotransferase, partial [Terriglobia bacterium]